MNSLCAGLLSSTGGTSDDWENLPAPDVTCRAIGGDRHDRLFTAPTSPPMDDVALAAAPEASVSADLLAYGLASGTHAG